MINFDCDISLKKIKNGMFTDEIKIIEKSSRQE